MDYVKRVKLIAALPLWTAQTFISELVERLWRAISAVGYLSLVPAARAIVITEGGAEYGFAVSSTQTFVKARRAASSTAVRQALAEDNLGAESLRWDIPLLFPGVSFAKHELTTYHWFPGRRTYRCAVRSPGQWVYGSAHPPGDSRYPA